MKDRSEEYVFNLLASCGRNMEFPAVLELERVLSMVGAGDVRAWESGVKGLIYGYSDLDPKVAVERLRGLLREKPWEFSLLKRVIPIERVTHTDLSSIRRICEEVSKGIGRGETYRITVEKRHSELSSREIIKSVAELIDAKVSLEKPDKILLIEIVRDRTGISLLDGEKEILNIQKELLEE